MQHFFAFSLGLSILSVVLALFIPESPRYLYEKKEFGKLRETLSFIAKINGAKLGNNYFVDKQVQEGMLIE